MYLDTQGPPYVGAIGAARSGRRIAKALIISNTLHIALQIIFHKRLLHKHTNYPYIIG